MKQDNIWLINLDPTIGAEIKKTRPAIIVNNHFMEKLPLKIIVPLTNWKEKYKIAPWMIKIEANPKSGLTKISSADCFQIRSISEKRFVRKLGKVSTHEIEMIQLGISKVLSLEKK
ncbi:MAG: type II toxin-antitoxin system PemK/MazF family toxin [Bacteroidota bacterium]|nr:type II toxin-antitoxin system PemK/MazF family toxin [Bacteroidota bacterium]